MFLFGCFRRRTAEKQDTGTQKCYWEYSNTDLAWGNRDSWFYHRNKESKGTFSLLRLHASFALGEPLTWLFWTLLVRMSVRVWNRSTPQNPNLPRTGAAQKEPNVTTTADCKVSAASPWINIAPGQCASVFSTLHHHSVCDRFRRYFWNAGLGVYYAQNPFYFSLKSIQAFLILPSSTLN